MSRTTEALAIALVRRAARAAPSSLSARLEEEWLADMHERASVLSSLGFAIGCYWAGIAIGLEHRSAGRAVASTAPGNVSLVVESPRFLSSRAVTFGLVLSLHAAIFGGLMMAGTKLLKPAEPPALQPRVIDQSLPQIKPPPWQFHGFVLEPPKMPPVLPPVDPPIDDGTVPKVALNPDPGVLSPLGPPLKLPPHEIARVQGGVGPAFPHPDDYYPDASKRLEEQGAAVLRVCVDGVGRLTTDPVNEESSGSGRLDAAAVRLAKAGSGYYRPTTQDGRPVSDCYSIKIRFQLRN